MLLKVFLALVLGGALGMERQYHDKPAGYATNWTFGCGADLKQELDLRSLPCCYLLDSDRTVLNKSMSVETLITAVNSYY